MNRNCSLRALAHLLPAAGLLAGLMGHPLLAHDAEPVEFNPIGIPYAWRIELSANESTHTGPAHVGAWSWDEDSFPETAKGWTHTSAWVQLDLTEPVALTLTLESANGVPWPSAADPTRLAGTNLFPSFTLYRGWDTDAGTITNADGTTLDQDHTFNNRGNIEWAEDVTYLDHLDNATAHSATRTWVLPAGRYTVNLGGNSPAVTAEGRQGYKATFTTRTVALSVLRRDATSMTLTWPSGAGPLRRTDRIGGDWSPVEGTPSDDGIMRVLTVPIGEGQAFYRIDGSGTSELTRDRHDPGATSRHGVAGSLLPIAKAFC